MDEQKPSDRRVEHVKERLHDDLVDDQGHPADAEEIARAVDAAAESLADAPVQEFTPLLVEHQARDALRAHGYHRDLREDDRATSHLPSEATPDTRPDRTSLHLSTQQGLAAPDED